MKTKYRFSHRSDDGQQYYWESERIPGDSRVEQIRCRVDYFWNPPLSRIPDWTSKRGAA